MLLENLPFPASANLTAAEILTFLPGGLRCADVVYRFFSNGGTRQGIHGIISTNRFPQKNEWSANICGSLLYRTMRKAGFDGWTCGIHELWHKDIAASWNEEDLSVAGFKTPCEIGEKGDPAGPIPFSHLANGVKKYPAGNDALDLTRMVTYAVEHPNEHWQYPTHYDELLEHIGGPHPPSTEHTDRYILEKWDKWVKQNTYINLARKRASQSTSATMSLTTTPRPMASPNQLEPHKSPMLLNTGIPKGTPRLLPAQMQRTKTLSGEVIGTIANRFGRVLPSHPDFMNYVRRPATLATAPDSVKWDSADTQNLLMVFGTFRYPAVTSIFSPYAFLCSRDYPPFRMLHHIDQPHPGDVSGWAENLRWAAEQHELFGVESWTECPEHMRLISRHRFEQIWVSDEWLADYMKRGENVQETVN
ncbi:hypothetical protein BU24DRAFT_347885 [Aaosphaeria arxii CBS 175.79]|uniref:Uncharacterized protein n=1 Tax=Aaosphaeria arxii CBS 175.79 TaxID=1450172 RepID=A0A6A5XLS3_9PLEO|nr:uncharacterized protein BU24DRAFT_347885 [Aaosphaeria arxii CBS 175.79]KAF2014112.1 hypothetical protein BU24DRAFT_347885 [Aaosphaeria arxii CBS 175.79]